jgi:hypothetical protein
MAKPDTKAMPPARLKLRFRYTRSGMMGSADRRSTMMNAIRAATVSTASPMIWGENQSYWVPPQVVIRISEVIQTASRPVPAQSMRAWPEPRGSWRSVTEQTAKAMMPSGRLT